MHSRPLTAQEVLERDGYVICWAKKPDDGTGQGENANGGGNMSKGDLLVKIGEATREEAISQWRSAGWQARCPPQAKYFYKTVAE